MPRNLLKEERQPRNLLAMVAPPPQPAEPVQPERNKQNEAILGSDFMAGAEEAVKGVKEMPAAALRGAINVLQSILDIPQEFAATEFQMAQEPVRLRQAPRIPKPAEPETMLGKATEIGADVAVSLLPVERLARAPRAISRMARGAKTAEVAAPEVAQIARVAEKLPQAEAIQASEAATKAADALTPRNLLQERALPKKVEGFSSKRYTPPEAATLEAGKGFREPRTFAEIKASAEASGMSVEDLLKTKRGAVWSSEEAFTDALTKGRMLRRAESQRITALKDTLDPTNPEHLKIFDEMKLRFAAVAEKATALESESGRALGSLRMDVGHERRLEKAQRNILAGKFGEDPTEQIRMLQSLDDPVQVARFMRLLPEATTGDKVMEFWINGLLSGPQTHAKNIASNALVATYSLPERAVAATLGLASRGERVYFREVAAQAAGMAKAMKQGTRTAWKVMKDEGALVGSGKVELRTREAIKGAKGYLIRTPGRALEAADQWFKAVVYGGEMEARAVRTAIQEGKTGAQIGERAAEILANPPDAMTKAAWKQAEVQTFTNPLSEQQGLIAGGARAVQKLAENHASARVIFPFIRTPTNVFKFSIARSPLGFALKDVRLEIAKGGIARQRALANITLGSSLAATTGLYALDGKVTGAGPSEPEARRVWRLSGRQPYSVKIGDKWYAYGGLEPLGTLLGISADFAEIGSKISAGEREKLASIIAVAFSRNVKEKTFLQGMSQLVEALDDPDRFGDRFLQNLAGSAIPTGVAQVARADDPTIRDARGIMDKWLSRIPGASGSVEPLVNLWGEDIKREGGFAQQLFSPIYISTQKDDKVAEEMIRLEVSPRMPRRDIGGAELDPKQYTRYVRLSGQPAHQVLQQLVNTPQWKQLPDEQKRSVIEDVITKARRQAQAQMLAGDPTLLDAYQRARQGQ